MLEYTPSSGPGKMDLRALATTYIESVFGHLPSVDEIGARQWEDKLVRVSEEFELGLYRRYYARRAYWLHQGGERPYPGAPRTPKSVSLEGLPSRLPRRLQYLGTRLKGERELRKALADWNLPHRRQTRAGIRGGVEEVPYSAPERTLDMLEDMPLFGQILSGTRKTLTKGLLGR